eukprot:4762230-Amphidinium_carterae.1
MAKKEEEGLKEEEKGFEEDAKSQTGASADRPSRYWRSRTPQRRCWQRYSDGRARKHRAGRQIQERKAKAAAERAASASASTGTAAATAAAERAASASASTSTAAATHAGQEEVKIFKVKCTCSSFSAQRTSAHTGAGRDWLDTSEGDDREWQCACGWHSTSTKQEPSTPITVHATESPTTTATTFATLYGEDEARCVGCVHHPPDRGLRRITTSECSEATSNRKARGSTTSER